MMLVPLKSFSQSWPVQTDSIQIEKYRIEIGINMSVPDFDTKAVDAKIMGTRLTGIIDYLVNNYKQPVYNRKLCQILKEQEEQLEKYEFELMKLQFVRATKSGDEITLLFIAWPDKNAARVKQTELIFRFKNGVSNSQVTNELFSMMSRYVQSREELKSK